MTFRMPLIAGACALAVASVAGAVPMRVHATTPVCRANAAWMAVRASGVPARTSRLVVTVRLGSSAAVVGRRTRLRVRRGTVSLRVPLAAATLDACAVPAGDALEVRMAARIPRRAIRMARAWVQGPVIPRTGTATAAPGADGVAARPDPARGPAPDRDPGPSPGLPAPAPPPITPPPAPSPAPRLAGTTRAVFGVIGPPITEASGLAWSRGQEGVLWTHNDSGDAARVFALGWGGTVRATLPLTGVSAYDVEDIALGTGPGGGEALFVGDIGDNAAVRPAVRIYRVAEPPLWGLPAGTTLPAVAPVVISLSYPDGARDAEALVADRTSGDLYVITKREARSRVYRATAAQVAAGTGVMHLVGEMPYGGVVGADACADGTVVAVKTYDAVRVHESASGIGAALLGAGSVRPYMREPQGEAIAVDPACADYATLSEGAGQPLVRYAS